MDKYEKLEYKIDLKNDEYDTLENSYSTVNVASLTSNEFRFKGQSRYGCILHDASFYIFQTEIENIESIVFCVEIYKHSFASPVLLGTTYVLSSNLIDSLGNLTLPVISANQKLIGSIILCYPIVGIQDGEKLISKTMWYPDWKGLNIGHRGAGSSYNCKNCSILRENTLASLKEAVKHGADMVEFDVQLSHDNIPVIYHDFHCFIAAGKRNGDLHNAIEVPVHNLTLSQMHMLKIYHAEETQSLCEKYPVEDMLDHLPFPTLQDVCYAIESYVGFNLEIKCPMQLEDGSFEVKDHFDVNKYVDAVLNVLFRHSGSRTIILSCFHPDVCTLLRLKQNHYPVLFLTQGVTQRYPAYMDPRTHTVDMAIYQALSANLLGLSINSENIIDSPELISKCKYYGLVVFCWGEELNDRNVIRWLKRSGVDALIYDKIYELNDQKISTFSILTEREKQHLTESEQQNQSIVFDDCIQYGECCYENGNS